ncbi:hypothetical protein ACA910_005227 [Epithemia clementina (nom. ined.)]
MSFRPDFKNIKQDMPPPGGYPKIDFFEKARARGPSGATLWTAAIIATIYGYYMIGVANDTQSKENFLEREARITMVPFLQAEADLAYIAQKNKQLAREAEIMKDVPGWKVGESVYRTKRWVPDQYDPFNSFHKK